MRQRFVKRDFIAEVLHMLVQAILKSKATGGVVTVESSTTICRIKSKEGVKPPGV